MGARGLSSCWFVSQENIKLFPLCNYPATHAAAAAAASAMRERLRTPGSAPGARFQLLLFFSFCFSKYPNSQFSTHAGGETTNDRPSTVPGALGCLLSHHVLTSYEVFFFFFVLQ